MNRKCVIYSVMSMLLVVAQLSFAMNKQIVFYGAKLLGAGIVIGGGAKGTVDFIRFESKLNETGDVVSSLGLKKKETFDISKLDKPVPSEIKDFVRKKLDSVGVSEVHNIPIVFGNNWAVLYDRVFVVDRDGIDELSCALNYRAQFSEGRKDLLDEPCSYDLDKIDKKIALTSMIVAHEAKHIVTGDNKEKAHLLLGLACGVQGLTSAISGLTNKIFKIQAPKTWPKTLLRSSGAMVSAWSKLALIALIVQDCCHRQEFEADEFACKNAQSIEELKAFQGEFIRIEDDLKLRVPVVSNQTEEERMFVLRDGYASFDIAHPYPGDRAANIQRHIDRFDQWKDNQGENGC